MIKVTSDSNHPEWYTAPAPVWNGTEWRTPDVPANNIPENAIIAAVGNDHSRILGSEVVYDHNTKRRTVMITLSHASPDEIAVLKAIRSVHVE